ncbi:O-antigen ligase family protein [Cellulophaga algicola]|nr:O-antigen ligase family protein [Cellulophaga algicola]
MAGYLFSLKINDNKFILKTILIVAFIISIKHLITLASLNLKVIDIGQIRQNGGDASFIELFALILLIFRKRFNLLNVISSNKINNIFIIVILTSSLFYFSRTMILGFFTFYVSILGYTKFSKKAIKYSSITAITLIILYIILSSIKLDPTSSPAQSLLFKIRNAPSEVFESPKKYSPNNHKEIYEHWRAYEASNALNQMSGNPMNYLIGKGFGSLIDLKFMAPIGGLNGLRYIPHLHNGYIYIFFKTGCLGLLIYLLVLYSLYKKVYDNFKDKHKVIYSRIISGFALYFFFTTLIITGIYNLKEASVIFLGIFLYFAHKSSTNKKIYYDI